MLEKIHEAHLGTVKCKQLAQDYVFWPGMSQQIEDRVTSCNECQTFRNSLHQESLICHAIPETPYSKVGIVIFKVKDKHFILLIDYYSKYP